MSEHGTPDAKSLRLFVAIELPQEVRAALAEAIERLKAAGVDDGLRWVRPEGIHITLKFLGATDEEDLPAIVSSLREAVREHAAFSLQLGGLGTFGGNRNVRVVWAGVAGKTDALASLATNVDQTMAALHFPRESRPFAAHLTLARVRDDVSAGDRERIHRVVSDSPTEPGAVIRVEQIALMESTLQRGGAVYRALATFPLEVGG